MRMFSFGCLELDVIREVCTTDILHLKSEFRIRAFPKSELRTRAITNILHATPGIF